MVRTVSNSYKYYKYLENYSTSFIRQNQTNFYYELGRKSHFDVLVRKFSIDSLGYDFEHNYFYKTPVVMVNLMHRVAVFLTLYYLIYNILYLGDQTKILLERSQNGAAYPVEHTEQPMRYENIYKMTRDFKLN